MYSVFYYSTSPRWNFVHQQSVIYIILDIVASKRLINPRNQLIQKTPSMMMNSLHRNAHLHQGVCHGYRFVTVTTRLDIVFFLDQCIWVAVYVPPLGEVCVIVETPPRMKISKYFVGPGFKQIMGFATRLVNFRCVSFIRVFVEWTDIFIVIAWKELWYLRKKYVIFTCVFCVYLLWWWRQKG